MSISATETVKLSHEIEGDRDEDYICLDVELEVSIYHQDPYRGSAYSCSSDMDYYGYTEIESIEVLSVKATNMDNEEVDVPAEFQVGKLDPNALWDDDELLEQAGDIAADAEEAAKMDAAEAKLDAMQDGDW